MGKLKPAACSDSGSSLAGIAPNGRFDADLTIGMPQFQQAACYD